MGKWKSILIVDDDKEFLDEISHALKAEGLEVATLSEGQEVLDTSLRLKPDVILLDIKLGKMSGFQIADRLRRNRELMNIPIIAITGVYTEEEYGYIASNFGIRKCLIKPIRVEEVLKAIEKECGDGD